MSVKLEEVLEKIASAEDSITLTKEELEVLRDFGEGILSGVQKVASAEYSIPMSFQEVVEIAKDNKEALAELDAFLAEISGGDEKVASEIADNITFWVNPSVGIVDVVFNKEKTASRTLIGGLGGAAASGLGKIFGSKKRKKKN